MRSTIVNILLSIFFITIAPANAAQGFDTGMRGVYVVDTSGRQENVDLYGASHALLIGVSNYNNGWVRLSSIPRELDMVENFLRSRGFTITRVDDPDSAALEKAFENFIDLYGYDPQNRLLFFYSGHGHSRKNGRKGYLVPIDAPDPHKDERGFLRRSLPMVKVMGWAKDIEAKHALFLFDSCFSGAIFKQRQAPTPTANITRLSTKPVRQFITAGSADESVPANSTFTPAFIDALKFGLADANKDGYVTGSELGQFLQNEVPLHAAQHPEWGKISDYQLSRGDFIFISGGKTRKENIPLLNVQDSALFKDQNPGNRQSTVQEVVPRLDTEEELWNIVKKSSYPAVVRGYIEEYPEGRFRKAAELRLIQLDLDDRQRVARVLAHQDPVKMNEKKLRQQQNELADKKALARARQLKEDELNRIKQEEAVTQRLEQERINRKRKEAIEQQERATEQRLQQEKIDQKKNEELARRQREREARQQKAKALARLQEEKELKQKQQKEMILSQMKQLQPGEPWIEPTTGMEFVWIKGGCFMMGQPREEKKQLLKERGQGDYNQYYTNELPSHEVCVDDFYLGKYEVTQAEWSKVMGHNPAKFRKNGRHPVEMVSWRQSMAFIEKLSSDFYRLPTEAEWEYAARAGTTTPFSFGDSISPDQSNFDGNFPFGKGKHKGTYREQTTEVGSFPANPWGLHDMHGNVLEWTADWYAPEYYKYSQRSNPSGPSSGRNRVIRGGCWYADGARCRSANRRGNDPRGSSATLGFRVVFFPQQ